MKTLVSIIFAVILNSFFNQIHSQDCVVKFIFSDISEFGLLQVKIDTTNYFLNDINSDSIEINHHSKEITKILIGGFLRFPNLKIINVASYKDTLNLGLIKGLSYSDNYSIPISDFFGDRNSKEYEEYSKQMENYMREYERNELSYLQEKIDGKYKIRDKYYSCEINDIYNITIDYSKPIK